MKKTIIAIILSGLSCTALADSAAGTSAPLDQFYQAYNVQEIPLAKMQSWPYYTHVSMNMPNYVRHGADNVNAAETPAQLSMSESPVLLSLNISPDQKLVESLINTQTKGFVVMQDNKIITEFYDNGYQQGKTNNLQSASKTFAGVVIAQLVDQGLIDLNAKAEDYLPELKGTVIGQASIQNITNMSSGIQALGDYHTPGSRGYLWEIEIGLQSNGQPQGHLNAIKDAPKSDAQAGTAWEYSDQNTDTLALIAEQVTGKKFPELLQKIANDAGFQDASSIARTSDGSSSPAYGINVSARDYALFHQYIAQGKAGETFYKMAKDLEKDVMRNGPGGAFFSTSGYDTAYGAQAYYLVDEDILMSIGSFGQIGLSDLKTGIAVINQQDWSVNMDVEKMPETVKRSVAVIKHLRAQAK